MLQISIKGKITTSVNKLIEAAEACENCNKLERDTNPNLSNVQAFMMLDTGEKTHIAGFGEMFENFIRNQNLGHFSGKGTVPVESRDAKNRNSLLIIERYQEARRKQKRPNEGDFEMHLYENKMLKSEGIALFFV